jgi:Flp pilus assembly protein TadG
VLPLNRDLLKEKNPRVAVVEIFSINPVKPDSIWEEAFGGADACTNETKSQRTVYLAAELQFRGLVDLVDNAVLSVVSPGGTKIYSTKTGVSVSFDAFVEINTVEELDLLLD